MSEIVFGSVGFSRLSCSECGTPFAITADFMAERRKDHKTFYCPNGHSQYYPQKNEADRLRLRLEEAQASRDSALACCNAYQKDAERAEARARGYKGWAMKLKRRVEP